MNIYENGCQLATLLNPFWLTLEFYLHVVWIACTITPLNIDQLLTGMSKLGTVYHNFVYRKEKSHTLYVDFW